ncbi:efflux RND transporter periplasmic adaptor subunit [Nonomuraea sp. NPDC050556]|uniref:efflux RND transporter periplasmic adaptor subunit n=1 Tax=Nonomuraea sp. NPDC050556 TaxID=3364369 RepID=UPI0037B737CE
MTIPRTALTLGGLAVAVAACTGVLYAMGGSDPAAVQIQLASAKRGTVSASVSAAGSTASGTSRDLAFGAAGTVTKLYVRPGMRVRKGAVLARVDGTAAREQYAAAKADLAAAEDALSTAGTCTTNVSSGAGVVAAFYREPTPTPSPSEEPTTHEPEPTATVTVTATATVTVTATATVTASPYPTAPTPTSTAPTSPPSSAPSASPTSGGRPSATPSSTPTGKPSTTPTARPTGKPTPSTGVRPSGKPTTGPKTACKTLSEDQAQANVDRAEAALEEAEQAVTGTRILAPAAGTVLTVAGAVGDTAGTGTFISLGNLNELHVEALFTESDVNHLKLGQQATITLATRKGQTYNGTVTRMAPTATTTDQLVRYAVTIAFDDPPKDLMLGQTATVVVTTAEADQAIYVPAQSVRTRADGTAVVTVESAGTRQERQVKTGVRSDTAVQITEGLTESDKVVVTGATTGEFPDTTWPG